MRRDWWGRALSALIGVWLAAMIGSPAGVRPTMSAEPLHAQRALPDRTRVVSAREAAPDTDRTPPAHAVARECSNDCGEGGRRGTDGLPTASVVALACVTRVDQVEVATAPCRLRAAVAHTLPPALGPPSTLV